MKFLIAFATLAVFAGVNANGYGAHRGYGNNYGVGRVAYVQDVGYGNYGSYGNHGYGTNKGYGGRYAQPLVSSPAGSAAAAAASAAASSAGIRPGKYDQVGVVGYELESSYNGPSHGAYGSYGRGY